MSISKSRHTHSHILKHMTPTFKHMTPTHIKSLTHHSYKHSMGGGFTLPLLLCAYSKANSPALGFKEPGQPPAPRMGRGGEGREEARSGRKAVGGGGGSGRMTSPFLKCHHYLKPQL